MADRASVEKTVTETMLATGEIRIGAAEQSRLGFPDHSDAYDVVAGADKLPVAWTAGRRRLSGEALLEYLQDTARVDDLVRIERRGTDLSLVVQSPLRGFDAAGLSRPPPTPSPLSTADASDRRALARRRGSRGDRYRLRHRDEYEWRDGVGLLKSANDHLLAALRSRGWDPHDAVKVRLVGEELATLDQFEELLALDAAHIEHMPHQEAAARTALTRLGGRAVLADEVGLGKTIEAGLVIKELLLRGLADRVLVVCPAPLRDQWREELKTKFDEDFDVVTTGAAQPFRGDRLIMTLQLAIRNAHRLSRPFDLVVIDEAHRLTGANARRTREVFGELLSAAPRALLLTATPVQNNLLELHRLVELLRPGTFRSQAEFTSRYVHRDDPRRPANALELRRLVSSVVVRTTREQAGVDRVHRMPPRDQGVRLTEPERTLYHLIVETLRHRMKAPGDAMRRRSLALRLTASPQAISRSALRMAERHPDPRLGRVLSEIGHLAADISHTAREKAALAVVRQWLDEHGRVLVFTQHTETLLGLQRMLVQEGIVSAPFHGSMAHSARAKSVADFRSGAAPVLVSTDAGAEGQNLQVSNCVLNYDLPWNPMRVEQRIGRVHRLTQTRNVHIANLFARDTLDESVYRLLHDKLAMFELLFGQVVTVLGELEGNQDSTMERRLLDAVCEPDDAAMRRRLDELGDQLEQARGRAVQMMNMAGDRNQWLAQRDQERRDRAAQPQARELLPDAADGPRRRQRDVEWFVCEFLSRAGARLESPSEGFTIVTLTPELSAALDGREQLYLAFSHPALDAHPEAELCVVGAEVFDEIMHTLRERGDLTGTAARIGEVDTRPPIPHAPGLSLVARRLEPASDWSARATFRVQEGAATGSQYLSTIDIGTVPTPGSDREQLPDGAPLPPGLTEKTAMAVIGERAAAQLRDNLSRAQVADQDRQRQDNAQVMSNLQRQLAEVEQQLRRGGTSREELEQRRGQLKRALDVAGQATISSETELRAELLTLELHGSNDIMAVETWQHSTGVTREITYAWTQQTPELTCEATGDAIRTLALCTRAHSVDGDALARCFVCADDTCGACGPGLVAATCAACGVSACGRCRNGGVLCPDCRNPEPDPTLGRPDEHGWRLGAGAHVRVGRHHAVLTAPDGTETLVTTSGADRDRVRALAARLGVSASSGLLAGPTVPSDEELSAGAIWCWIDRSVWWAADPESGDSIDPSMVDVLPDLPPPPASGETDTGLGELLAELRDRLPPPPPAAIVAMPFVVVQRVDIDGAELVFREVWYDGTGEPHVAVLERATLEASRHEPVEYGEPTAATAVGPVRAHIDRLHRSYLCRVSDGAHTELVFVSTGGALIGTEAALAKCISETGLPARYAVVRHPWPGTSLDHLAAARAAAGVDVDRKQTVVWALVDANAGETITEPPPSGAWFGPAVIDRADAADLQQALDRMAGELTPMALAPCLAVEEIWRSPHGSTQRGYLIAPAPPVQDQLLAGRSLVAPGEDLPARADDDSALDQPLSVDSVGHLHDPVSAVGCPVCGRTHGRCCANDAEIVECGECDRLACRECRDGARADVATAPVECQRCGDRSCAGCSRRLTAVACALCGREVCPTCLSGGDLCTTCAGLSAAGDHEIAALPPVVAARGLTVLIGHDDGASVAVLLGTHRSEVVVVRDATVLRWETSRREPMALMKARLEIARRCGVGDVAVMALAGQELEVPDGVHILHHVTRTELLWAVTTTEGWQMGNVNSLQGQHITQPAEEVYADLLGEVVESSPVGPAPAMAGSAREWLDRLHREAAPDRGGATVTVTRRTVVDVIFLDSDGLRQHTNAGGTARETTAAWRTEEHELDWPVRDWSPRPDLVASAELGEFAAAVAAVGRHALVGVRHKSRTAWSLISEDHDDLLCGAIGARLTGKTMLLSFTAAAKKESMRGPIIVGARREAREIAHYAEPSSSGAPGAVHPEEIAAVMGASPGSLIKVPPTPTVLPIWLRTALSAMVQDREIPRPHARVGLRVRETWRFSNGAGIAVRYLVPGGETDGHFTDAVTGAPLHAAHACRALHLVARVRACTSCLTATCGACSDDVRPCLVCGSATCGQCADADLRCPVCAHLRKVRLLGRLAGGVGRGDEAWVASRGKVKVTIRRAGATWSVERIDHTGRKVTTLAGDRLTRIETVIRTLT